MQNVINDSVFFWLLRFFSVLIVLHIDKYFTEIYMCKLWSLFIVISGLRGKIGLKTNVSANNRQKRQTTAYEVEILIVVDFSVYTL